MPESTDAIPKLVEDAKLNRLMVHGDQCEQLMCEAIRRGDTEAVLRYNRLAQAACIACLDLLTR